MCAAAGPVPAKARCSTSPTPWTVSMPSRFRAARRSGSRPAAGCRPGSPNRAAALRCAARSFRSCRARSCSICSTAATRPGAASRPTAISATPPPQPPAPLSHNGACEPVAAARTNFAQGSGGAGLGATTANFKGGIGSASAATQSGVRVAALAVVNAVGAVTGGDGPWFWAAPFEIDGEYGGRGLPPSFTPDMLTMRIKGGAAATSMENTTLAIVVTDAELTKPQAKRLAMIAQTGFARAIYPVHAPLDGDVVFAAATGEKPVDPLIGLTELGMVAANVVARAIARGVYTATALPFPGAQPAWKDRFG